MVSITESRVVLVILSTVERVNSIVFPSEKLLSLLVDYISNTSTYLRALCLSALCALVHNCQKAKVSLKKTGIINKLDTIKMASAREIGKDKYSKMSNDSIIILKEIFTDQRWHQDGGFVVTPFFPPLPLRYRRKIQRRLSGVHFRDKNARVVRSRKEVQLVMLIFYSCNGRIRGRLVNKCFKFEV